MKCCWQYWLRIAKEHRKSDLRDAVLDGYSQESGNVREYDWDNSKDNNSI
jgi:hypothetical protein